MRKRVHLLSFSVEPRFEDNDIELERPIGTYVTVYDDDFNLQDSPVTKAPLDYLNYPVPEILIRALKFFKDVAGAYCSVTREQLIEQLGEENIHTTELLIWVLSMGLDFELDDDAKIVGHDQFGHCFQFRSSTL
jgi:hypothetical protein